MQHVCFGPAMSSDEVQDKNAESPDRDSVNSEEGLGVGCELDGGENCREEWTPSTTATGCQESPERQLSSDRENSNSCATSEMSPSSSLVGKGTPVGGGHLAKRKHRRQRRRPSQRPHQDTAARHNGDGRGTGRRRLPRSFRRAISTGERRVAMAPWNNNQFLLEDHGVETPSFLRSPVSEPAARMDSSMSEEDTMSFESGSDEGEFLERNFAQMYHQVHTESLSNLRHSDLVARCLELEDEVSALSKRATDLRAQSCDSHSDLLAQLHDLREENDRLKNENDLLVREQRTEKRRESASVSEE